MCRLRVWTWFLRLTSAFRKTTMVDVHIESTYENIYADCPHCGYQNIFNRASDLKTFEPIAGRDVACTNSDCRRPFRIVSDRINPAHQALLFDCADMLRRKQYMQCVLAVAQSYE